MPIWERKFRSRRPRKPPTSTPSTEILPERIGRNPLIVRNRVVLPAPLGPRMAIFSPRCTLREIRFSTRGLLWSRRTTRSRISSMGIMEKPGLPLNEGYGRCNLKHLQVLGNQPQNRIFLVAGSNKIRAAENLEDLVVLTLFKIGESLSKLFLRNLINVLAGNPYIIHKGL